MSSSFGFRQSLRDMMVTAMFFSGYYQPAGPLIHAGAEMCCVPPKIAASNHPSAAPPAPNSAVSPLLISTSSGAPTSASSCSTEVTSTSSTLPSRIVSSQVSPFSSYQPQYAPHYITHYSAPPQYAVPPSAQYYHPPPTGYAPPTQHYFPHTSGSIYSAPPTASISNPMHPQGPQMPSSSASKLPAPSTSAAPTSMYHHPAQHLPPEPPHYHFYAGYSPGGPAGPCFPHPAARGVAFMDSPYQTCPCPMQSCSKNVHAGPLTGDSKGPGPQESLFVLPTAAAAALPGESLAGGHPPSPARGSSGGPAAAQGTPPLAEEEEDDDEEEEQVTPPAWVAAEPTPPPSDDSSAARASYFYDQVDNSATDVNQNYNRKRKHALSSSTPLGGKKSKLLDASSAPPPKTFDQINNNCTTVPPNLNEPLLITTTMLADASKVGQFDDMSKDGGGAALPLTPPTSSDTSPSISSRSSAEKASKAQSSTPAKEQFQVFGRSLESASSPKTNQKESCETTREKPELGRKARKRSGQNTNFKRSKRAASASTLAAEKEAEELAQNDLMRMRKSFQPKWSNGWTWEGEPYHAKVFLRSDDPAVLRYCYPAMRHPTGDTIRPRDCILLKSGTRKGDLPYVAKVTALWENPDDGEMMLSLLWFYRPEHTEQGRQPHHMADEIFASKHKDSSSVACIEDKCYVLTFNEYCRYRAKAKQMEVGASPRTSIVPQQSLEGDFAERSSRQPLCLAAPDLVFFCQRVYDFRCKRMLKNPGA
ncbi:Hypothetical predicted protein [Cloeon dipterum]|uniref:BAH domain-containing protein n=1 Tax=Cloeon dipterum TaxID=197152 RepID=A0A8S1CIR5_9INSE|nr:Hypothetical predicted protein [Cloeon dipterum]